MGLSVSFSLPLSACTRMRVQEDFSYTRRPWERERDRQTGRQAHTHRERERESGRHQIAARLKWCVTKQASVVPAMDLRMDIAVHVLR